MVSSSGGGSFVNVPLPRGSVGCRLSGHPDPGQSYTATSISLSWDKPGGANEFSYVLDQAEILPALRTPRFPTTPAPPSTEAIQVCQRR